MSIKGVTRRQGDIGVMSEQMTARGGGGVVAAAAPVAARHAANALEAGGNVYDAVLTATLVEAVALPPKCGPAGDVIALVWEAGADRPEALLAIGGAPAGLRDVMGQLAATGPLSIGVPGAPAGYEALAGRSRLGVDRAAAIAEQVAVDGFAWSTVCTVLTEEALPLLQQWQPDGCVYLPHGVPLQPGELVELPRLGAAVAAMARAGSRWADSHIADDVLRRIHDSGGVITRDDLRSARAEWTPPDERQLASAHLFASPAPTHGASLLMAMGELDDPASEPAIHRAVMAAVARSRATLADPSGTSMVSAVDRWGNAAVVIHSNSFPQFGSGIVVPEHDLILCNRAGRGFSSDPSHPNSPMPGRRPATTLHAWGYQATDGSRVLGATPGGANQMPWNVQTLARIAAGGWSSDDRLLADAIVGPRWQWEPSDDSLRIEEGFSEQSRSELAGVAATADVPRWGLRSAMQIVATAPPNGSGVARAFADPRTQAAVLPV